MSFPFVLLCIVELLVRWFIPSTTPLPQDIFGWSEGIRPAAGYIAPPLLIESNGIVTPNPALKSFVHPFSFAAQPSKKRIFCLGGSATLGVPFEKNQEKTFPGQLFKQLYDSGEETEVINLGGASFGSDHVLALGTEALSYNPDFIIVYSGNNEFFNHMINLEQVNYDWVQQPTPKLHLLAHLQKILSITPTAVSLEKKQEERWTELLYAMINTSQHVDEKNKTRTDPIQKAVIERYIHNLRTLYQRAHDKNVPILFTVVPSNLYTPPALSLHSPKQKNKEQWTSSLHSVDIKSEACTKKLALLLKQNPWNAQGWYQAGLCAQEQKLPSDSYFLSALNLDMLPGRPNQSLQKSLLDSSLPLVLFDAQPEYFHDSCHLTQEGYTALAHTFALEILVSWNFQQKKILQNP